MKSSELNYPLLKEAMERYPKGTKVALPPVPNIEFNRYYPYIISNNNFVIQGGLIALIEGTGKGGLLTVVLNNNNEWLEVFNAEKWAKLYKRSNNLYQ